MLSFVQSSFLEQVYINEVLDFLRNYVFPHEELYARCYFLHVRAFDAYSNTPHEGTNAGTKYCENRVLPSMSQTESTKKLTQQDNERGERKRKLVSDSFNKTQLHFSDAASQRLQKEANSHLRDEIQAAARYISLCVDGNTWLVLCGIDRKIGNSPIPEYDRVRTVTIDDDNRMMCSCGRENRFGIPDRHMAHVAMEYGRGFTTFDHHSVAIRHHNAYCKFVATKMESEMNVDELAIRSKLLEVRDNNIAGPKLEAVRDFDSCEKYAVGSQCDASKFPSRKEVSDRIMKVKEKDVVALNYSEDEINRALRVLNGGGNHAAGFSQSQHNCDESDDDSGIAFNDWDASVNPAPTRGSSAYAEAQPHLKDFQKAIEGLTPEGRMSMLKEVDLLTKKANELRRLEQGIAAPKGSMVSAKLPSKAKKQRTQNYYYGSSSCM